MTARCVRRYGLVTSNRGQGKIWPFKILLLPKYWHSLPKYWHSLRALGNGTRTCASGLPSSNTLRLPIVESLSALPSCLQKFLQYPKVWYQKKALDELNQIPPGPRPENGYFGQKLASKGQKSPSLIRVAWGQFSTFFKNYFFQK